MADRVRHQLPAVLWALASLTVVFFARGYAATPLLALGGWSLALAAASAVRLPAMSGDRLALSFSVAAAVPFLVRGPGGMDYPGVLVIYAGGYLVRWVVREVIGGEYADLTPASIRRSVGAALYAAIVLAVQQIPGPRERVDLLAFAVAAIVWFGLETALWALSGHRRGHASLRYLWQLAMRDWSTVASLFVVGALFAFSWPALRWWTLPIVLVPFSFAYLAFRRSHTAQVTYSQTIRALSRIPEVAGLSPDGHSDRTAQLSVAVAKELGMRPDAVTDVEYAARMHDIGRVSLNEPSVIRMGFTEDDIARWGSEIIAEAPYLERVASLVRQQHSPYRRPGEQRDLDLPLASKIIRAASAFDHATNELGFSELEALEVLHRGAAYDFDPDVVEAVRAVVDLRKVGWGAGR